MNDLKCNLFSYKHRISLREELIDNLAYIQKLEGTRSQGRKWRIRAIAERRGFLALQLFADLEFSISKIRIRTDLGKLEKD